MNVGSMHLITRASLSEDTVYNFTKTLYERRDEVVKKHPAGRAINPKISFEIRDAISSGCDKIFQRNWYLERIDA